jgi:putative ABC transport system permease protein
MQDFSLRKQFGTRPHLWLIAMIGVIVPRRLRADWRQEWEAELRYRERMLTEWDRLDWRNKFDLLRRSLAAFWDALWLQPQRWEDEMFQDLRFGARMLLNSPNYTLIAVLTLALGIGANTAIFSVVNAVLLKPLPYDQPGLIIQIWEDPGSGDRRNNVSPGAFHDWRENSASFENVSLLNNINLNLIGAGEPERLRGVQMSANGLSILRARPLLGRTFAPDEDQPGKDKVVVLTHQLWQRRWNGDPAVVGRTILLSGQGYTVIGVLSPNFLPWETAEFVIPSAGPSGAQARERGAHWLRVLARLKAGVSVEQAQTELNAIARRLKPLYPASKKDWGVTVVPLHEQITGKIKPTLLLLLGAVSLVLLIACANVANLLLAKASGRAPEIAVRAALGASAWRIARQLLTESSLLALLGGALGLLLASSSIKALARLIAVSLPRAHEISLDARVLGFTLLVSLVTGVAAGNDAGRHWAFHRVDWRALAEPLHCQSPSQGERG